MTMTTDAPRARTTTMRGAEITGLRGVRIADRPMPRAAGQYVLVKVLVAPMCNEYVAYTDGVYLERNRPDSLGHEFAGEVVTAPPGSSLRPGQRVVALCGFPCGHCEPCGRGYYAHCAGVDDVRKECSSETGDCGFAQYALKADWMLEPIPDGMPIEYASLACCGLGPTFGAMERLGVGAGSTVMITGLGAVGLGGVLNAKARGARVIGVGRTPFRTALARRLGCDVVVGPDPAAIRAASGGRGPDFVLECSGQERYQRLGVDAVARLGSVAFLAEPGRIDVHIDDDLVQRGVSLVGTLDIRRTDARRLLTVIQGIPAANLDAYITHRLPIEAIGHAFEEQAAYRAGKILLDPWAGDLRRSGIEPGWGFNGEQIG